jgi:2,3-bisphosphoglycerate-independent phosphoglycerate mutase
MEMDAFPLVLIILDGWGLNQERKGMPFIVPPHRIWINTGVNTRPQSWGAAGESVGLPAGQMGNSEVGHLNLGAGRIVYQDFTRISKDIAEGRFFENQILQAAVGAAREKQGALHLLGFFPMEEYTAIWNTSMPCWSWPRPRIYIRSISTLF